MPTATVTELVARVTALLSPTVGGEVPEHRLEEADVLARAALATAIDGFTAALANAN